MATFPFPSPRSQQNHYDDNRAGFAPLRFPPSTGKSVPNCLKDSVAFGPFQVSVRPIWISFDSMRPITCKQAVWGIFASILVLISSLYLAANELYISEPNSHYDYIIVGAGTAGCVLAEKLSANRSHRVLLIESGGDAPWYSWIPFASPLLQGSRYDWAYRTVAQNHAAGALHHRQSFWPQGKMLGGSGQMNFLIHSVGSPQDFDSWHVDGWDSLSMGSAFDRLVCWINPSKPNYPAADQMCLPERLNLGKGAIENATDCDQAEFNSVEAPSIQRDKQCAAAAIKLEQINANNSPLVEAFLQAGKWLSHPISNLNRWSREPRAQWGFMSAENTIHRGRRWSTYQSHLKAVVNRANLHVLPHSTVTKVLIEENQTIGVQLIDSRGQTRQVLSHREVLLSAGSIKSPQILQLSGIGPSHVLEPLDIPLKVDLPVGENLQDHLQVPLFVELANSSDSVNVAKILRPMQLWNYFIHKKGIIGTSGIEAIGTLPSENGRPRGMLILFNMGSIDSAVYSKIANIRSDAFRQWFPKSDNYWQEGFVLISVCLHPKSRGHVRITSADPLQQPQIDPKYLTHSDDVECLADTIRHGARMLETEPFKRLGARLNIPQFRQCLQNGTPANLDNDDYIECLIRMAAITMYHPSGTCSMGVDESSVVDPFLRVRGVKNLRVVDASILPKLTSGPPNSVLVAVAERAARFVINGDN